MAVSSVYLEHYINSLETLPADLQRNMNLMRDLDTRAQEILDSVDFDHETIYHALKELEPQERSGRIKEMQDEYDRCLSISEDKVQLAVQTYDLVDKYIRKLDSDVKRLEAELLSGDDADLPQKKKSKAPPPGQPVTKVDIEVDMPVDPNEPTYCICHCVSHGEMIACDNLDCATEWFHFGCVGLTQKPKGKWYCPACRDNRKKPEAPGTGRR